ncbi:MAG: LON peptidase substrate-binding domain-containing protein, partial [Clostridia bacterium]|nr:LON peptidase substrate-binding domain-containing protein [Clostridia bacterium]
MEFKTLPVLPLRGVVLFPHQIAHFDVGRDVSVEAITRSVKSDNIVFVTSQLDALEDVPTTENIYECGTVAAVRQMIRIGEKTYRVILEGLYRAQSVHFTSEDGCIFSETVRIYEFKADMSKMENISKMRLLRNGFSDYFDKVKKIAIEPYADVGLCEEPDVLTDIIAGQLLIDIAERQELLSEPAVEKRMERLLAV